jgi:two-component SAPR family response regulator
MEQVGAKQRNYLIISDNDILLTALRDNTDYIFSSNLVQNLKGKVDILLVDLDSNYDIGSLFRANVIVNLTKNKVSARELRVSKPIFLQDLINIISKNAADKNVFCSLGSDWIYHERSSVLLSQHQEISLTSKENELFKALLMSKNRSASKSSLKKTVWNHHQDTESTTIETHIYKLKQKLPDSMLEIKNSIYILNVDR